MERAVAESQLISEENKQQNSNQQVFATGKVDVLTNKDFSVLPINPLLKEARSRWSLTVVGYLKLAGMIKRTVSSKVSTSERKIRLNGAFCLEHFRSAWTANLQSEKREFRIAAQSFYPSSTFCAAIDRTHARNNVFARNPRSGQAVADTDFSNRAADRHCCLRKLNSWVMLFTPSDSSAKRLDCAFCRKLSAE